ncbi:MAG TPA: DNRLRE domain-containing protein [Candidatus Poseidoniales archaeon]|nr:DNRLRE domain-containing protein [Candidatus Poseidoniales archaeon]
MKIRAILLSVLMLATIPNLIVNPVTGGQVTHFGMAGQPSSVNLTFSSAGYDISSNFTLGANEVVSWAELDVKGLPDNLGNTPNTISIDVGDDQDLEWAFGGPGNGSFGHLNELSNGWSGVGVNVSTGYNTSYSLRLPLNATINSASVNFSTLSELTLSGNNMRDAYIHNPNPTWGNATYKDCNYGNSTITVIGKTEWSNWHIYRSLYWFDLTQLPSVTVLDANLSYWVDDVANNANTGQPVTAQHTYTVRPLLKDWVEGLDYNVQVTQGPGVTWNKAIDNLTGTDYAWSSAGASSTLDRGATVASITESPANLEQTWMEFNSQSLTNLVQSWVNGSVTNQGILLLGDENTNKPDASMLKIMSRDNSTHGPKLVILFEGTNDVTAGFDVGNDNSWEWSHAGNLSNATTIPDFSSTLNSLLANASATFTDDYGNEFVDIPLNISGNATLILDDIDIRYDWQPTVTISPHGDFVSEINQHLSNLTPDATGNVSISINVSSGSAGIVELSNLMISTGDRPPSIGTITLPAETLVPNGVSHQFSVQVTSYQGLTNLSWVGLTPQLQNVALRPTLLYSLSNSSVWVNDPGGYVESLSGQWQSLNSDTGLIQWDLQVDWAWPPEKDIVWEAQAGTVYSNHTERLSTDSTDHERRMEITSFHVIDETNPTDGSPEILDNEWVGGGDILLISGDVRFLDELSYPLPQDVQIELINITGNGTVDGTGAFSINSQAPSENRYGGFTIEAEITGPLDATPAGTSILTFRLDNTMPGMVLNAPILSRMIPSNNQLFNISIAESTDASGIAEATLQLRWWVESLHDDNQNGIPEEDEYRARPLVRQGTDEHFHATYEDLQNVQGEQVSLFVEGEDNAGNLLNGGGAGFDNDLHHYISLVPEPTTLTSATLEFPAGIVIVPSYEGWFNLTLNDVNGGEDIENIVIDMGQGIEFTWQQGGTITSNNNEVLVEGAFFESNGDVAYLNLSFMVTSLFNPAESHGEFLIHITDTSGLNSISTFLDWEFNADIMLTDFGIFINDSSNIQLQDDDYLKLEEDLLIVGRVRYTAIDLPPQADSFEIKIEVPLDLPLAVNPALDGTFFGEMNAHGSGIFRVSLEVLGGKGIVAPTTSSLRLQIDDQAPLIVGSKPNFIPANSTNLSLQFDIQEQDSGISQEEILVTCKIMRGFQPVGTEIHGIALIQSAGVISRHIANLTSTPLQEDDSLECWLTLDDLAGNQLTGAGSSQNWPISFPVIELRPDLHSSDITLFPETPIYGKETLVNITIVNLGNYTYQPFFVSLETLIQHDEELQGSEIGLQEIRFLEGETTTIISFSWAPEWHGELDLIVTLDTTNLITERNETNTQNWTVSVEKTSPEKGFFISQSMLALGGLSIIIFFSVAMFLAMRAKREEDTEGEWEEVTYDGAPDQQMKGKYEDDGHEYLQWPTGSEDWWYRNNSESEWAPWEKD